ncbi:MAG: hypothetical protein U0231_15495 [Nitrospiraceae bacterium]
MDKHDPKREAKFKTYAEFRIQAMLDEIRSMDWIPSVPCTNASPCSKKTYTELLNRLGHPPTDQEVAAGTGGCPRKNWMTS